MSDTDVILHIRLSELSLRTLKDRARARHIEVPAYIAMILRYALLDAQPTQPVQQQTTAAGQEVYLTVMLPAPLRSQLANQSERTRDSLATFAGNVIARYLDRFERDPVDLLMMSNLAERLDHNPVLSDYDIEAVMRLAFDSGISRMAVPYQVRWYHTRIQSLLRQIQWQGQSLDFTSDHVAVILTRMNS